MSKLSGVLKQMCEHISTSTLSEYELMRTPRPCYSCDEMSVHRYHMMLDHTHKTIPANPDDFVTVTMDAPCETCEVGEASCCACFSREENGCDDVECGLFVSFCRHCIVQYTNDISADCTYRYCPVCSGCTECPKCGDMNYEKFSDLELFNCQNPMYAINCATCFELYTPRDTTHF
jgi:hypothetical protein